MKRRSWSTRQRAALFAKYDGICFRCGGKIRAGESWEVSHEQPLELGGADDDENAKPEHARCHRAWTREIDIPAIAKAKRREAIHRGWKAPSAHPLPGGRKSAWRKKINGQVVARFNGSYR